MTEELLPFEASEDPDAADFGAVEGVEIALEGALDDYEGEFGGEGSDLLEEGVDLLSSEELDEIADDAAEFGADPLSTLLGFSMGGPAAAPAAAPSGGTDTKGSNTAPKGGGAAAPSGGGAAGKLSASEVTGIVGLGIGTALELVKIGIAADYAKNNPQMQDMFKDLDRVTTGWGNGSVSSDQAARQLAEMEARYATQLAELQAQVAKKEAGGFWSHPGVIVGGVLGGLGLMAVFVTAMTRRAVTPAGARDWKRLGAADAAPNFPYIQPERDTWEY